MSTYCDFAPGDPVHGPYHDTEYGFPVEDESELFERLILEINQAGLSWDIILKKRSNFRSAYGGFDVDAVASYEDRDRERLLEDSGIIRNRLKVKAAIENARKITQLRESHGSFAAWLAEHHPRSKEQWVKLFRKHFAFVGGEIVGEFLKSIGYLQGAHDESCPVYARILALNPPWAVEEGEGSTLPQA